MMSRGERYDRAFLKAIKVKDPDQPVPTILDLNKFQWHRLVNGRAAALDEAKKAADRAETFAAKAVRLEVSRNNWRVAAYAALALALVFLMALISATHRSHLCQ